MRTIETDAIVVGSGNAALCAAISARQAGANVLIIEKADAALAGGNSKYTAGAMRFAYNGTTDILPLLANPDDSRLSNTDFGAYTAQKFGEDLLGFNDGRPLSAEQQTLIDESYATLLWLSENGIKFNPIYERQSFLKDGKYVFWGGLTLAAENEGVGLVEAELDAFLKMGGQIHYQTAMIDLLTEDDRVVGVSAKRADGAQCCIKGKSVVLACGGFESNSQMRQKYIGSHWDNAKVRGTPHNNGDGLKLAFELGAKAHGHFKGCHATPMDLT